MNPFLIAGIVGVAAYLLLSRKASASGGGSGTLTVPTTVIPGGSPYPYAGPTYATIPLSSDQITYIQNALNAMGYGPVPVDGLVGPDLKNAVRAYQQANGLKDDGIIGPETWGALQNWTGPVVDQAQTSGLAEAAVVQAMGNLDAGGWSFRH